jgi:hypothetical protein
LTYALWRDRLLEGVDEALYPAAWLDLMVGNGTFRCWASDDAAIIAAIKNYPSGAREVHGMVAAGDIDAIKSLVPFAEQWGREHGATRATIASHPAWSRLMRNAGYEPEQLQITKEL